MINKITLLKVTAFLATIAIVFALFLYSNQPVEASQSSDSTAKSISVNQVIQDNLPIAKPPVENKIQSINGIQIQLTGVKVSQNLLQADVCFELPSDADWLVSSSPDSVFMTVGEKTILHSGFAETEEKFDANGKRTQRCDRLDFPITPDDDLSSFTITINQLVTSISEQPDCDKAQKKLDSENTDIKIKCDSAEGGFNFSIDSKPSKMSDLDARKKAYAAFSDTFTGPWVFTTGLK